MNSPQPSLFHEDIDFSPTRASSGAKFEASGRVERIYFADDREDFYIFALRTATGPAIRVQGILHNLRLGTYLECVGSEITHPKFGVTIHASHLVEVLPDGVDDIRQVLYSGLVPGIGRSETDTLIDWFGARLFDVAAAGFSELDEIPNFDRTLLSRLVTVVQEKSSAPKILRFLLSIGVAGEKAKDVLAVLGVAAIQIIEDNPYSLLLVPGLDFRDVDRIAVAGGQNPSSSKRVIAALNAALNAEASEGSTCVSCEDLLTKAERLLRIDRYYPNVEKIAEILGKELTNSDTMCARTIEGKIFVSTIAFYEAELQIAHHVKRIDLAPVRTFVSNDLLTTEEFAHLKPMQKEGAKVAVERNFSVITGGPGFGKTTLIKAIVDAYIMCGMSVLICTPTGRAAQRVTEATGHPAITIHRALGSKGEDGFDRDESNPLEYDAVIVDEFSMVHTMLASALFAAIPTGTRVVLVGDRDQLLSIQAGQVFYDLIRSDVLAVTRLIDPQRFDKNGSINTNARLVGAGKIPESGDDDSFLVLKTKSEQHQLETLVAEYKSQLAFGFDKSEIQILTLMKRQTLLGANSINEIIKEIINPKEFRPSMTVSRFGREITFSVDDRVMQTLNDDSLGISNGNIGYVKEMVEDGLTVDFGHGLVHLKRANLNELEHAYATTVHKSQGSEFRVVLFVIAKNHRRMHGRSKVFTGMTRGRDRVRMIVDQSALKSAIENSDTDSRRTGLHDCLRIEYADS